MATPELTPQEIRVKCAEELGWKFNVGRISDELSEPLYWTTRANGGGGFKEPVPIESLLRIFSIPDFLNDLNACAQLRASLTEEERTKYVHALGEIATKPGDMGWGKANATAEQICRAFLKTKGIL